MPTDIPPAPPGALVTREAVEELAGLTAIRNLPELTSEVARCWGLLAPLPCGHPAACAEGNTTRYCGWCAAVQCMAHAYDQSRAERDRMAAVVEAARNNGCAGRGTFCSPTGYPCTLCRALDALDASQEKTR